MYKTATAMGYANNMRQNMVQDIVADRREGLVQLYSSYAPALMGLISKMVPEKSLAEEMLQQTFVEIWARRAELKREEGHLLTWMLKLTRKIVLNKLPLKQNIINEKNLNSIYSVNISGGLEQKASEPEKIPSDNQQKAVLDLIYLYGLNVQEVAGVLKTTVDEVKKILRVAMKRYKTVQHG